MTHLLHQMIHYRTTLRGSEQSSATIARITIHTHATILKTKRKSSESGAIRYLLRVTLIHRQGWVQDDTPTQRRRVQSLDLLLKKIKNGVSTNVLSKSNHTHGGGINRV